MFQWIGSAISFLTKFFAWATFVIAVCFALILIGKRHNLKTSTVRWWVFFCISSVYAIAFLVVRIFFPGFFYGLFSIIFMLGCIISTAWSRYEDRVNGKRWWTQ